MKKKTLKWKKPIKMKEKKTLKKRNWKHSV